MIKKTGSANLFVTKLVINKVAVNIHNYHHGKEFLMFSCLHYDQ